MKLPYDIILIEYGFLSNGVQPHFVSRIYFPPLCSVNRNGRFDRKPRRITGGQAAAELYGYVPHISNTAALP